MNVVVEDYFVIMTFLIYTWFHFSGMSISDKKHGWQDVTHVFHHIHEKRYESVIFPLLQPPVQEVL